MKRWIRNTLAAAAIMSGSGLLLAGVGYSMGAHSLPGRIFGAYTTIANSPGVSTQVEVSDYQVMRDADMSTIDRQFAFNSIDLDISVGDIKIQSGDEYHVSAQNVKEQYLSIEDHGGQLSVNYDYRFSDSWPNNVRTDHKELFIITVPKGHSLNDIYVSGGVGTTKIDDISSQVFDLECGVGDVIISNSHLNNLDLEGGVGNVKGKNISVTEYSSIECGVGNIDFDGIFTNIDITGGVGNANINLRNTTPKEYNYSVESGLGIVTFDGKKISSDYEGTRENISNAPYNIFIESGLGNIDISFNNKPVAITESEDVEITAEFAEAATITVIEDNVTTALEAVESSSFDNYTGYQKNVYSFSDDSEFSIVFKSDFEEFSGDYVVFEDDISKSKTRRKLTWVVNDDDGYSSLKWIKPDGSVESLVSSVKDSSTGAKVVNLESGKHKIVLSVPQHEEDSHIYLEFISENY